MSKYDFSDELRGDERQMNVKNSNVIPAIIVGVIVSVVNVIFSGSWNRGDSTVAALAELKTQVSSLSDQVKELKGLPYVRQYEYSVGISNLADRITGLERRLDSGQQRAGRDGR